MIVAKTPQTSHFRLPFSVISTFVGDEPNSGISAITYLGSLSLRWLRMAQGGSQLDYHILQDLKQRFPEIPEGVVSQYLLQVFTLIHTRHAHKAV